MLGRRPALRGTDAGHFDGDTGPDQARVDSPGDLRRFQHSHAPLPAASGSHLPLPVARTSLRFGEGPEHRPS